MYKSITPEDLLRQRFTNLTMQELSVSDHPSNGERLLIIVILGHGLSLLTNTRKRLPPRTVVCIPKHTRIGIFNAGFFGSI